jgi:hypothetical protein
MKLAGTLEEIRLKTGGECPCAIKVKNFENKVFLNPAKS